MSDPRDRAASGPAPDQQLAPIDVVVFLAELVLLAALAVSGARLGRGAVGSVVLAVVLPGAAAAAWGRLLAPRARLRLRGGRPLAAKLVLVLAAALLLAVSGAVGWALAFGIVTALVFTVGERSTAPAERDRAEARAEERA